MRLHHKLFAGALALAGLLSANFNTKAQDFALAGSASPNPVVVSNTLTYTIYVTNAVSVNFGNVFVTNSFSDPVVFTGVTSSSLAGSVIITNSDSIVFRISTFLASQVEELVLTFVPESVGSLTNQITVVADTRPAGATTTNFVAQVNIAPADLAISMTNVATGVFAGDTTTIGLTVTNLGPGAASGVVVSNTLPSSFELVSVTPTNASFNFTNATWNIGTLASGSATQLLVLVRPTIGGTNFSLTASVSAASTDANTTNNAVTNSITIETTIPATLVVTVVTPQHFNPQTGLMEEVVRVTNAGTNDVPSFRLIVSGLGTNWLYNAVGTNNGVPYVLYSATLSHNAPTNYVDLLLEYFVWNRTALTNLTNSAIAVTFTSVPTPTTSSPNITKVLPVAGGLLIEFQSTPGRSYTILYADNMSFSNALAAQPAVTAIADRVQWIDSGPPKTITSTTNASSRFYRVLLNP